VLIRVLAQFLEENTVKTGFDVSMVHFYSNFICFFMKKIEEIEKKSIKLIKKKKSNKKNKLS